ncbi:uncharacterized protein LOC134712694 [Mytilus trossulus]|uniref:uncharacterized protein LOC134712694 n=1 Tax=Mytilus trossulus TaxID=6551 RepID=UPI003007375A
MKIATIESELIYNLVKDYLHSVDMGSGCMWIGLYWELQTLRHVWDDGEPLTWAQWYNGAPSCTHPTYDTHCNGIERNCVSFTRHFNFRTKDCNGTCYMLCESNRSRIDITTNNINLTLSSATPTEITTSNINLSLSSATPTEITTSYINLTLSSATPTEITTSSNNLTLSSATPIEITTSYINLILSSATPTEITTNSNNLTLSSATPTEITTSSNNLTLSSATPTEITTNSNNLTLSSATPSEITASNINLTLSSATPTEEMSATSEITNVITASPALNTFIWKVGAWSFHYIHLDNEDVNLTHALQLCKEKNMDIVIIKDEGRLENIKDIIQYLQLNGINNTGYWIGMVWNENIQEHKWLDNYTLTWTKWADEEPKCTGGRIALWSAMGPSSCQGKIQNCVVSDGSFFKTSSCSSLHKVICQQYIPVIAASNDETRPKVLNCKCPMQKINQKWHFLDGTNISEAKVEKLVQKDFEDNVKEYISVNKSVLSSVIQKRNSIDDKRPESKAIGWSATLFVAVPVTFIIIVDVIDMMRYLRSP